ncbi:MAG: hypothetical protein ABWW69_07065 [Pyrodictiaceae archaeon]
MSLTELKKILEEKGVCRSLVEVERGGSCILYACKRGDKPLVLIAVANHNDWVYARLVPELGAPPDYWHCNYIYYTPYGLYAFARSLEELVEKIAGKIRHVDAIGILAAERSGIKG